MEAINDLISDIAADLQAKKDKLIFDRITERAKLDQPFNIQDEAQRMFPRIKMVRDTVDQSEHWYWNDGSIGGLHLISFYPDNDFDWNSTKFTAGFKYK